MRFIYSENQRVTRTIIDNVGTVHAIAIAGPLDGDPVLPFGGSFFFGALGRVHNLQSRRRLIRSAIVHHSGARVKRVSPVGFTRDDTRHMLPCSVIYRIQPADGSKRRIAHALLNVIKCEY